MLDPKPGTHGFFPALLNHLSGNNPIDIASPDAIIIHALLLCLITSTQEGPNQSRHLILRTSQAEDVGTVVKLVHSVRFLSLSKAVILCDQFLDFDNTIRILSA